MRALVFTLLFCTAPAAAADQFDLLCKGTWKSFSPPMTKPIDYEIRVDLVAKKYCFNECKALIDIDSFDAQNIWFDKTYSDDAINGTKINHVDRVTGRYLDSDFPVVDARDAYSSQGQCEPASFKGFPHPTTKF